MLMSKQEGFHGFPLPAIQDALKVTTGERTGHVETRAKCISMAHRISDGPFKEKSSTQRGSQS